MYLKKLELIGFKSFADKTEFRFDSGMTCVVGPNGCGKSNVVDAFKWIFGEQSAKGLRGSEMKDVIFNGTQSRKSAGYAEVTAVFDNSDRFFDIDFSELAITRQLFRSGESVYLINRQKSRLKDIKNLLMGTGIGATSYSIFEQGKIDVLLQASTLDRRIIFEEAAGISKYRARKNETLRALARVEDNLARVNDLVTELDKRRQRVRIQAGKARRYREYADRLEELRIRLAVEDFSRSVVDREELSCRRFLLDFRIRRLQELSGRLREGLERWLEQRTEKGRELTALRERLAQTRTRRERAEESIAHNTRRLEELHEELSRRRTEHADLATAIAAARDELVREEQDHQMLLNEVEQGRERLATTLETLGDLRSEHEELRGRGEEIKRRIVERMDERSRVGNEFVQIESELANLTSRSERLSSHLSGSQHERGEVAQKRDAVRGDVDSARGEAERVSAARARAVELLESTEARRAEVAESIARIAGEIRAARSRLEVLQTFEENLDGVAQGVASILRVSQEETSPFHGVHGLLAHLLDVDSQYALAVEAALGSRAQALVVDTDEVAVAVLRHAREDRLGAVELIALERIDAALQQDVPVEERVLGPLREKVRLDPDADPALADALDALLGRVVLVEDLQSALALSRNGLRAFRLVTLDGELVESPGSLSIAGDATTGLISRRSEMQDLERVLQGLVDDEASLQQTHSELQAEQERREAEVAELGRQRESVSLRLASLESRLEQLDVEDERLGRVIAVTESELHEVRVDLSSRGEECRRLEVRAEEIDLQRKALESEGADLDSRVEAHGAEVQKVAEIVTEAKVTLAQAEKREEGLRRSMEQLRRSLTEREERHRGLGADIVQLERRVQDTVDAIASAETALESSRLEEASSAERLAEAEREDEALAETEESFRDEIDRLQAEGNELRTQREEINLADREGVLRRNGILERVSQEYDVDLVELIDRASRGGGERVEHGGEALATTAAGESESLASTSEIVASTGQPADEQKTEADEAGTPETRVEPVVEVDVEPTLEERVRGWLRGSDEDEWDHEEAEEEARELQEKIRRIGAVNLEALDELDELDERLTFQIAQRDDLIKSERDLRQIIAEINKTCRELFSRTFAEVQQNFGDVFSKCFGGGKAELVLEDGADILEAGIEIIARPPGKKLTSLTLMSGGEKTMTTIALMFAIFKARPSPFCILDEVDAPLDENNVRRFVVLLQEFVSVSQFIIVTHNKITMGVADTLYGVTMQERGVSKRVSVQFESYDPEDPHASMSTADIDEAPVVEAGERTED